MDRQNPDYNTSQQKLLDSYFMLHLCLDSCATQHNKGPWHAQLSAPLKVFSCTLKKLSKSDT